jgi:hypothetical protein
MANYINSAEDEKVLAQSDTATFPLTTGGIWVETDGEISYVTAGGTTITKTIKAGYHPIQIKQLLLATGAIEVHGLYAFANHAR